MRARLRPALGWRELAAALRPPRAGDVARFEAAFAREMGARHAVAFSYGRTGLYLLLKALGLEGREVLCPAYTCVVVPHAIRASGNVPVFVDAAPDGFNMDLDRAAEAVTERTGAIIPTSLFGYPVDLDRLDAFRARFPELPVIQDCAHSFAAEWRGRPVQNAGDAALYGLNISKLVTSIFGGMVTTDRDDLAGKLRALAAAEMKPASLVKGLKRLAYLLAVYPAFWPPLYALVNRLERTGALGRLARYYDEGKVEMPRDFLVAMARIEARVGAVQMGRYRRIVEARRAVAARYNAELRDVPELKLPPLVEGATYSHYVCLVEDREAWLRAGLRAGVQLGWVVEYSVPHMAAYREHARGDYPRSLELSQKAINLPVWGRGIRSDVIRRVADGAVGLTPETVRR